MTPRNLACGNHQCIPQRSSRKLSAADDILSWLFMLSILTKITLVQKCGRSVQDALGGFVKQWYVSKRLTALPF
jgi:hypothetical protein